MTVLVFVAVLVGVFTLRALLAGQYTGFWFVSHYSVVVPVIPVINVQSDQGIMLQEYDFRAI